MKFTGTSHADILKKLLQWMKANGEPIESHEFWLNRIKNQNIEIIRKDINNKRTPKLSEAWHAGLALLKQGTGNTVDQAEHSRRAEICSHCPMKGSVSICMGCGGASKLSQMISSISKFITTIIKVDKRIKDKYCNVCGCSIALLSVTEVKTLPKEDPDINRARPIGCWMRVGGKNYKK